MPAWRMIDEAASLLRNSAKACAIGAGLAPMAKYSVFAYG
jgi:hypothetical protein